MDYFGVYLIHKKRMIVRFFFTKFILETIMQEKIQDKKTAVSQVTLELKNKGCT